MAEICSLLGPHAEWGSGIIALDVLRFDLRTTTPPSHVPPHEQPQIQTK